MFGSVVDGPIGNIVDMPNLAARLPVQSDQTVLRKLWPADLLRFHEYRSDKVLARFQGWSPLTERVALLFLEAMSGVSDLQFGDWSQLGIANATTDELIGDLGLHISEDGRTAAVGFTLCRYAQCLGHATRAVRVGKELVLNSSKVAEIRAVTDGRNAASVRVLERAGFKLAERQHATFKGEACIACLHAPTKQC